MYVKVHVRAGVKKEELVVESHDHLLILVKEKAERNMANRRVIEMVAGHFSVTVKKVRIISGHHSPSKMLSVDNE